jgi:hypothetical protein
MIGVHHHAQLFAVEMGFGEFFPVWPGTEILPISASQLARITGLSHHTGLKKID